MEKIFLGKYRIKHRIKLIRFAFKVLWYALKGYELTIKAEIGNIHEERSEK